MRNGTNSSRYRNPDWRVVKLLQGLCRHGISILYCIVLMGWSLLPNATFLRSIVLPELNTRTWTCRLNFAQRPIFSGLRFFNEPEISDSGPPALTPSRRTCAQDFYVLKKSIDFSRVRTREPWISRWAVPRDHQGRLGISKYSRLVVS